MGTLGSQSPGGALGSQPLYGNIGVIVPRVGIEVTALYGNIGVTVPRGGIGVTAPIWEHWSHNPQGDIGFTAPIWEHWGHSPQGGHWGCSPCMGTWVSQPLYGNIGVTVPRGDIGVTAPSSQLTPHPLSPPPRMKLDFGEVLKARVLEEVRRGLWCWGVGVGWRGKDGAVLTPLSPQWFPLQDGGRGRLHLRLEWLTLLPDASKLEQVRG